MDIKTVGHRSYPVVSTQECGMPLKQSQEASFALSPTVSDEIIDYVEIQTNKYRPVLSRQAPNPIRADKHGVGKGTLIDIWI